MIKRMLKRFVFRLREMKTVEQLIELGLTVGENFNPQFGVELDSSHCWLITIGNNVTIAPHAQVLAHDASTCGYLGYAKIGRVNIGDNVFIGAGAIILPNVTIEDNVIVGAGAVVTHSLKSNAVYSGNPAIKICSLDEFKEKHMELMKTQPCYDEAYTLRNNISKEKKQEQKRALSDGIGYVV